MFRRPLPFASALLVPSLLALMAPALPAQASEDPLFSLARVPGAQEGSERWFVTFEERSFDLETLRERIRLARQAPIALPGVDAEIERLKAAAAAEHAEFGQLCKRLGVEVQQRYWLIDAWLVEARPEQLERLRAHESVAALLPERPVGPAMLSATDAKNHRVDAYQGPQGYMGKGVTIAVLDTGQDAQHANSGRPHATYFPGGNPQNQTGGGISGSRLLANYQIGLQPAEDIFAHGTSVAAIAAGEKWNSKSNSDRGFAPEASLVGYGIADLSNAYAHLNTMVLAWQQVVADAAKHNIRIANMSYDGSAPSNWPEQMAMDYAVLVADLFVTVSAGNYGTNGAHYAHGACNIFAVGAAEADVHKVASFSSRGPNWYERQRDYPHLVANGVGIVSPLIDNEGSERTRDGTSYAAAMVAGSAALYRSVQQNASALETRAAVLATLEDIRGKNQTSPFNTVNAYGYGYLRTDQIIKLATAQIQSRVVNSALTQAAPSQKHTFAVQAGVDYAVALSWNRLNVGQAIWSDLNLSVQRGTTLLAESKSQRNCNERVAFRAEFTGNVDIVITAPWLEAAQVPFAMVACEALPPFVEGAITRFGTGCKSVNTGYAPICTSNGRPMIGGNYDLLLALADPQRPAVLVFGTSNTMYGPLPLPLDLAVLGAPGCSLYASWDVTWPHMTGQFGTVTRNILVPNATSLIFQRFYHQGFVLSAGSNALDLVFTAGLEVQVGGDLN
jgi:hypothetical protein